ncbi:MAG: cytochrome c oxidase subunit II [Dehalococcoidia bacterium]|nr:cytochrome c oxidase subunit II [Dehalococcoidia bacterium]
MKANVIAAVVFWAALTLVGEAFALSDLFPAVGSDQAKDFDHIFRFLLFLGIPVFTVAVSVIIFSLLQFRARGPEEDGPAMRGTGLPPRIWLAVTGCLAVGVMIYPGLTGLSKLQSTGSGFGWGDTDAEIVIKATGQRWFWSFEYVGQDVTVIGNGREVVLPVDASIKFEVNSIDVIHSLWVPAFRMKIDAIPGRTTFMTVKTIELGTFADQQSFRIQCAELCGLDHSAMESPVRVVTRAEYDDWLASQKSK